MSAAVCRVCLVSGDVKMCSIEDIQLGEVFERLTTNKLHSRGLPTTVCYVCHARLQRCRRLARTASNSHRLLMDILKRGQQISRATIPQVHYRDSHSLSASILDHISIDTETDLNLSLEGNLDTTVKQEKDIKKEILTNESKSNKIFDINCKTKSGPKNLDINCTYKMSDCDQCDKSFKNMKHLKTHLLKHETSDLKKVIHQGKYICSRCSKTFYRKGNLEKHMQKHTQEKLFACENCNKKFKQRSHLNVHLRIHTGEKLFACEICGKTFNQIANLNKHKSIHIGIKPFSCEVCNKAFLQRAQVKAHLRTHTGEKPYVCDKCQKAFSHAVPLRKHMKLHINPKPYICSECYHSFDEEMQLTEHLKVHSERGFKCDKCASSFKDGRSLSRHELQVHCGERQHVCPRCGNAFKRPQHLNKHMASAHCKLLV